MAYPNEYRPTAFNNTEKLPKWVRWFFRFYAAYIVLTGVIVCVGLVHSLLIQNQELIANYNSDPTLQGSGALLTALIYAMLISIPAIFFVIGILRFKRWVLPLILLFSAHTTIVGILQIFHSQIAGPIAVTITILHIGLAVLVGYVACTHWRGFSGSARRLLIQIPFLLLLVPILTFSFLIALFPDDHTINDHDLLLQPVDVLPPADNVYFALPNLEDLPPETQEAITTASRITQDSDDIDFTDPTVMTVLVETKELTDVFLAAAKRQGYQCPTTVNNYDFEAATCGLRDSHNMALVTSLHARAAAEEGKVDEAIQTAVGIVKIGSHITHTEQTPLIDYLVGIAIQGIGMSTLEQILTTAETPSNETVRTTVTTLEQAKVPRTSFANALRYEYMMHKNASEKFSEYSNYFYQHNKTVNLFVQNTRLQMTAASRDCDADTAQEQAKIEALYSQQSISVSNLAALMQPNYIGRVLFTVTASSLISSKEAACELNERNQTLQTQLENQT